MKTLKQACKPRQSIFDITRRDTVLSLNNLIRNQIDPDEFFGENHLTQGMRLLLEHGFKRLEGKSDQGVFRLTQAMGGGKTHNLLAFGLLAQHPAYRRPVMESFYVPGDSLGEVKVVAFSGRESDAPLGVWGVIAEQMGRKEFFNDYYSPLAAPGQSAWVNLLKGQPLIIMLDELPPYFENAKAKAIGNSDLSVVTATALSNLFVAVMEDLPNVCVVITDLRATYADGVQQIIQSLNNLENEANRVAMDLEPVRMNTDEFYHILRKRLFEELPGKEEIEKVAQGYARAVRDAKQMDITTASPEEFAAHISESYPFHPSVRDLYARFKENQGFQQTRGLIRLMRIVASRIWEGASDPYLIGAHSLDMNNRETLTEVMKINASLENAIAHDVAAEGHSIAEKMDANLGGQDAQDVAKLLLVSSLANVPGAVRGLAMPEIIAYLCEPGRDVSRLKTEVLSNLTTAAWYLHTTADGKLYFKDVQNLIAKLNATSGAIIREQAVKVLKEYLDRLFTPSDKYCYQDLLPLPAVDEIRPTQDRVLLVISMPHQEGLHPDLKKFYEDMTFQNRILFLTGQRNFDSLLDAAKRYKAIQQIVAALKEERTPDNDPQMVQAIELKDKLQGQLLFSVKETFNTLLYPTRNGLQNAEFLMKYTGNEYRGESQIVDALKEAQKYTEDISGDTFAKKVEARLFTQNPMPWNDIRKRAATNTQWQWHRPDALERLKDDCIRKDTWRDEGGGYIRKGPFPKPATSLTIQALSRDDNTGAARLRINPINADTIYAEVGGTATTASQQLTERTYETSELEVSFLAVDSRGEHETGAAQTWKNTITLKSRQYQNGGTIMVELKAAPPAPIRYTTDGSNPRTCGGSYDGPFQVAESTLVVQAYAESKGISSDIHRLTINRQQKPYEPDPAKPAIWNRVHQFSSSPAAYGFIDRLAKHGGQASGCSVVITRDDRQWVELQFGEDVLLGGGRLKGIIGDFRDLLTNASISSLRVEKLHFPNGAELMDFVREEESAPTEGEIVQAAGDK